MVNWRPIRPELLKGESPNVDQDLFNFVQFVDTTI